MLVRAVRNLGRPGLASYAIAAVDTALWYIKARLLGVGVTTLLDAVIALALHGQRGGDVDDAVRARTHDGDGAPAVSGWMAPLGALAAGGAIGAAVSGWRRRHR